MSSRSAKKPSPLARIAADNDPRNGTIAQRIIRSSAMEPDADGLNRHEPKEPTNCSLLTICVHCGETIGWASEEGDEASWRFVATPARLLDAGWSDKSICPGDAEVPVDADSRKVIR